MIGEILDLRTASTIDVSTASMLCALGDKCPLLQIYLAIHGMENYEQAVKKARESKLVEVSKENEEETFVDCQADRDGMSCGGMIIKKSLLERNPKLRYTAEKLITKDNTIIPNPDFGKIN